MTRRVSHAFFTVNRRDRGQRVLLLPPVQQARVRRRCVPLHAHSACSPDTFLVGALQCTRDIKGKRCRLKYCKACLKNRFVYVLVLAWLSLTRRTSYGEDHDAIRAAGIDTKLDGAERKKHVSNVHEYLFACPRCQSCCNCSICRKAAGLEATG